MIPQLEPEKNPLRLLADFRIWVALGLWIILFRGLHTVDWQYDFHLDKTLGYTGLGLVAAGLFGLVIGPVLEIRFGLNFLDKSIPVCFGLLLLGAICGLIAYSTRVGEWAADIGGMAIVWSGFEFRNFVEAAEEFRLNEHRPAPGSTKPPARPCVPSFSLRSVRVYTDNDQLKKWRAKFIFEHRSEIQPDQIILTNQAGGIAYYGLWRRTGGVNFQTFVKLTCQHEKTCLVQGSVEGPTEQVDGIVRAKTEVSSTTNGNVFQCSVAMGSAFNAAKGPEVNNPAGLPISLSWPGVDWGPTNALGTDTGTCQPQP